MLPPRPGLSRWAMSVGFLLTPTRFLDACHADCGEYFTLRPAADRTLVLTSDPDAVRQVFTADADLLHAGEGNIVLAPILGARSVLLLDGAEHLRHRRLLLAPFRAGQLLAHAATMREAAEQHVATWPRERVFPVLPSMQAITLQIILRVVFGVTDPAQSRRLGEPLRRLLDMVGTRSRVLALGLTAGRTTGPLSPWRRFAALRAQADRVIHEEIRGRRAAGGPPGDDIFSMLVAARDEHGRPLSDEELRDELMTLLVAGHETTATALAWTLERVTRHPEVLARLRQEAAADAGSPYLDAVIKETLRLRPVVPAVVRRLQAPMTFGGWDLDAGTHIAPSIYLLHRRPDLYPDPTVFRPERFLERTPGTYEWIPFGGGVRRCLGASFALMEMREVLTVVLRERPPQAGGGRAESTTRRAITFAPARGGRVRVAA